MVNHKAAPVIPVFAFLLQMEQVASQNIWGPVKMRKRDRETAVVPTWRRAPRKPTSSISRIMWSQDLWGMLARARKLSFWVVMIETRRSCSMEDFKYFQVNWQPEPQSYGGLGQMRMPRLHLSHNSLDAKASAAIVAAAASETWRQKVFTASFGPLKYRFVMICT